MSSTSFTAAVQKFISLSYLVLTSFFMLAGTIAHAETTTFTGTLTNTQSFVRPLLPGDISQDAADYSATWTGDFEPGSASYNYFIQYITPSANGAYTLEVTGASLSDPTLDTVLFIYSGSFEPTTPLVNILAANDDKDTVNEIFLSRIQNINLSAGETYVLVMTTFASGTTGTVDFAVDGPGSVTRSDTPPDENDNPTVTGLPATLTFTEDTEASFDISASAFSDPDSANITVTLTASAGRFGMANSGTVTLGGNGTGTITVTGTVANVNQYLDTPSNVTYTSALNANGTGAATVSVTANDNNGSGNISLGSISLNITAVNDAPTFIGDATLSAVNEDTASPSGATVSALLNANFSDVDGNSFAGIAVTASAANGGTEGKWQYSTNFGGSWYDVGSVSTSGALMLSAATMLRFLPVANFNGAAGALTVYAVDNSSATIFTSGSTRQTFDTTSDNATSKVAAAGSSLGTSITAVNDAPTLTATGLSPTFAEGGSAVDLFGTVTASTVESAQTFSALTLTVTNVSNGANEILSIGGTDVALSNGNAGTLTGIGNFSVTGTAPVTVSITGMTRDNAQMGTLVDGITYRNTATPPGTTARVVTLTGIQDNGGTANDGVDSTTLSLASTVSIDLASTITGRTVPSNGTYKMGQNLDFTVTYSEAVTVVGTPYIALTLDTGGSVQAAYSGGSTTTTLTFSYTVAAGNADTDGIVADSSITLNGGTIRDSGNANAPTTSLGFGATTAVLVDGIVPTVSSSNRQTPSTSKTNAASVVFRVTFSEAVTGVDAADFTLTATGTAAGSIASLSPVSSTVYDVTVNSVSGDGTLRLDLASSGTGIVDSAMNAIATGYTTGETYDVDSTAPSVTSVGVPSNATYLANQNLDFTVNWGEDVVVDTAGGTPSIALTIGSTPRSATYHSGSSGTALTFRYTVQADDLDSDGIMVGASVALNGGTLKDSAGNNATLTLNSVGSTANVRVDAVAPTVTARTVPADNTYKAGANLDFTVTYSENVTVVGTPYITLTLDTGGTVQAAYNGGTGTPTLTFRYAAGFGTLDTDGITAASAIELNGGTITDATGNAAQLTDLGFGATTAVLVDGVIPVVSSIARHTPSAASTNATSVVYRVTFSEAVTDVDVSDFLLEETGTVDGTIHSISGSGAVYDVTINAITGTGTLLLALEDHSTGIKDIAGNALQCGDVGEEYTIDTGAPTLPSANIVVNNQSDPHKVILTFSEALDDTTLGAASDWMVTSNDGSLAYGIVSASAASNVVTLTLAAVDLANDATKISNVAANAHVKVTPPATLKDAAGNAYVAGLVTEAGATHVLDTTVPTLSAVAVTASSPTSGTLAATTSEKARAYWIAVATGATTPNAAQVKAAVQYGAVTIVASGNGLLPAATAGSLALSNLLPVSEYDIYLVVDDAAGNSSSVVTPADMWAPLTAAPTVTTGTASSVGQTSATLNGNVNDNGLATTVSFDYGLTNAYGDDAAATTGGTITAGSGNTAASVVVNGLTCATTYHFRVTGVNSSGATHGNDATFVTAACAAPTSPNPFNPGGTQTQTNLDPSIGIEPTKAPSDIVTNLDKLDSRVGISDNGVVVVLDNGLNEPVKFRDNPPDNVLIAMPSQKPLDVQLNGNTLNIHVDPETPNPPKQTILSTTTLQLSDGTQSKGLQLVQGEAAIGNDQPGGIIGGLELSKDTTLRSVVVQGGSDGGTAGFRKTLDGAGSVSAESGDVIITVRLKGTSSSTLTQAMTLPGFTAPSARAATNATLTLTLKAGEVARFDTLGELDGVFLGSLSGNAGKTGDVRTMTAPDGVASYPASTLVFDGGNVPARLGMPFSDFLNAQLEGQLHFVQRSDGLMEVTSPGGGEFYARTIRGFEVVEDAIDGPTANGDGSLSLTYGGIRSTWRPMLEDAADFATYFAALGGYVTDVLENGNVQVSGATTHFFVGRPRHALINAPGAVQGLTPVAASANSLLYTNARGQQQLDPALHDEAQLRIAAAAQGWTLTRSGLGGNNLTVTSPAGDVYQVVPDFRVDILGVDNGLSGVIRQEGGKLYFYYADEPLRQGFTLK